jgi:hypothetical protein
METSASFEARSAPFPYPIERVIRALQGFNSSETKPTSFISGSSPKSYDRGQRSTGAVTAFGVVVRIEQVSTGTRAHPAIPNPCEREQLAFVDFEKVRQPSSF